MLKTHSNNTMNTVSNILVPIDFSIESKAATQLAFEWSSLLKCNVILLHTYRLIASDDEKSAVTPREIRESIISRKMRTFEKFKEEVDFRKAHNYLFTLELGFTPDSVSRYVSDNDIDLIIMGTDARQPIDSRKGFEEIIKKTAIPVLVVDQGYTFKTDHQEYDILSMENTAFVGNLDRNLDKLSKLPDQTYLVYPSPDHEKQFTGKLSSIADRIVNFNKST
ncbi:universal stress protein [Reichenbachiella versicolor]|uniref:universal stress protein n=1 Tax=Reichenbachiella versicolor TaxID=1821036 RepID=UPI000D6E1545|nr:universal stress protein [Reichenbachiella versicolor]